MSNRINDKSYERQIISINDKSYEFQMALERKLLLQWFQNVFSFPIYNENFQTILHRNHKIQLLYYK